MQTNREQSERPDRVTITLSGTTYEAAVMYWRSSEGLPPPIRRRVGMGWRYIWEDVGPDDAATIFGRVEEIAEILKQIPGDAARRQFRACVKDASSFVRRAVRRTEGVLDQ